MSDATEPGARISYRCHACEFRFAVATPGAATCPRCRAIGDHERIGLANDGPPSGGP